MALEKIRIFDKLLRTQRVISGKMSGPFNVNQDCSNCHKNYQKEYYLLTGVFLVSVIWISHDPNFLSPRPWSISGKNMLHFAYSPKLIPVTKYNW